MRVALTLSALLMTGLSVPMMCAAATPAAPAPAAASAPDQIVRLARQGQTNLKIYASPTDAKPGAEVALKDLPLPLAVLATEGEFLKVQLAGKTVWVDSGDVLMGKPVAYPCQQTKSSTTPNPVASMQGASSGCK